MKTENYTKMCACCGKTKLIEDFYNNSSFKDGKENKCKSCKKNDYLVSIGKRPIIEARKVYEVKKLPTLVKCEVYVPKEELTAFLVQMKKMSNKYKMPAT